MLVEEGNAISCSEEELAYDSIDESIHDTVEVVKKSKELAFADSINRLLAKETGSKPILAKNTIEKRIDDKKLEEKAKKRIIEEKAMNRPEQRNKRPCLDNPELLANEKKIRKIATRGVVKLFNAIRLAQKEVSVATVGSVQKLKNEGKL